MRVKKELEQILEKMKDFEEKTVYIYSLTGNVKDFLNFGKKGNRYIAPQEAILCKNNSYHGITFYKKKRNGEKGGTIPYTDNSVYSTSYLKVFLSEEELIPSFQKDMEKIMEVKREFIENMNEKLSKIDKEFTKFARNFLGE
jgi:hypothetical protein